MTGGRSYEELREHFMGLLRTDDGPMRLETYHGPDLYDVDRVTYIIPPVTDVGQRDRWNPGSLYVVKSGAVAIGRVFYTKSSGEYLIEELILNRGDIFGEFEVPLSILGSPALWDAKLPPRFNMTYGAWASGPSLNWAMAYPRYIPRDSMVRENARIAVHPFYIKSKNIRPDTEAEIFIIPIEHFETILASHPEATTWFLTNVLWKTRLYFEPPSEGYGRSPSDMVSRLLIRLLAYRIRLGLVVRNGSGNRTQCRTFIGPTEWLKYGLGSFSASLMEVVRTTGGGPREQTELEVFPDELGHQLRASYHFPVKDLDDGMLRAMGCHPEEDRNEGRYGLLTGIYMELDDLDFFKGYLLERGE
jgi:CRP-like cAMP-binding protein